MITIILIPIILLTMAFILHKRNPLSISWFCLTVSGLLSCFFVFGTILSFLNPNIEEKYEPVSVIQKTENGVVEVAEDTYYKDKNGEYYIASKELPKLKDNLWNPIVYAEMEKVDYPAMEYEGVLNE